MKSIPIKTFLLLSLCIYLSCNSNDSHFFINDNTVFEVRKNYSIGDSYRKLLLIDKTSKDFSKIKDLLISLYGGVEVDSLTEDPYYIISSERFKILIGINKSYILKKNQEGKVVKLEIEFSRSDLYDFINFRNSEDWLYDFGEVYGKGEFKKARYTFCGVAPLVSEYEYKVGNWKFWNTDRKFISQGFFDIKRRTVRYSGGCSYEINVSEVSEDWYFSNEKDRNDLDLLYAIENAKRIKN